MWCTCYPKGSDGWTSSQWTKDSKSKGAQSDSHVSDSLSMVWHWIFYDISWYSMAFIVGFASSFLAAAWLFIKRWMRRLKRWLMNPPVHASVLINARMEAEALYGQLEGEMDDGSHLWMPGFRRMPGAVQFEDPDSRTVFTLLIHRPRSESFRR